MPLIGDRQDGSSFPYVRFHEIESRVLKAVLGALTHYGEPVR